MKTGALLILLAALPRAYGSDIDPTGRAVFERYLEALGGVDTIRGVESIEVRGRYEVEGGPAGAMTLLLVRPDKLLFKVELEGLGTIIQASDGDVAWRSHPQRGTELLVGEETRILEKWTARGFSLLPAIDVFSHIGPAVAAEHDGRACRKVALTLRATGERFEDCFDAETGLLVGRWESAATPAGPATMVGWADGYRSFGPLTVATRWHHELGPRRWSASYESIRFNTVDAAAFARPDELQADAGHGSEEAGQ